MEIGWIVGNKNDFIPPSFTITTRTILKTTDGGESWIQNFKESSGNVFLSIYFIDKNNGWAVGEEILKTTNGGISWFSIDNNMNGRKIYFKNNDTGFVIWWRL